MQFVINLGLNTDDLKLLTAVIVAIFLGIPFILKVNMHKSISNRREATNNA